MRVLHVAPTAFGHGGLFGGGERYPLELTRALARADDVACELVTFGRTPGVAQLDGLRVRVVRPLARLGGHPAHPLSPTLVGGADVVHTHHLKAAPSRLAALEAVARRTPLAVTDHGLGGGDWGGLLLRLVHRFLTVSRYSAEVLHAPPGRTSVILGGADPARFRPDGGRRDGVLFVGRLTPHKGVDRLLEALPPGARLTVVGTAGHDRHPPERHYPDHLRRLAQGKDVRFLGAVPDEGLAELYRRAAVLVVPSVHTTCYGRRIAVSELLGLSAIEAMASGTPVVASRLGGLPEVVVDGATGHLVPPGDTAALRLVLTRLLDDPGHARRLGDAAYARAASLFTWDACAERCLRAYRDLVR